MTTTPHPPKGSSSARGNSARLYLDGQPVGDIQVKRWSDSWGYADFHPRDEFSRYAPLFGLWSLLMHEDESEERLSRAASEELSQAENQLDTIKSQLFFIQNEEWVTVAQLNIDGALLEWKEY